MVVKKIKPMYTRIITTMDTYAEAQTIAGTNLIDASKLKKSVKEYQKVVSVGTNVRTVKEGDLVCINPDRYAIRKFDKNSVKTDMGANPITGYNFNVVKIDGVDYLMIDELDIEFIVEEYEE